MKGKSIPQSPRFIQALAYAAQLHSSQVRKGTRIPYIAHLLGVTALVLESGGDEDIAIAALLHDAVEDQGGLEILREIQCRFGDRVALIVEGCTDAFTSPKPPWRKRKEEYITHLRDAPADVRTVSVADKLHNARSILRDLRENGVAIFDKFNGGLEGTLWYFDTLVEVFKDSDSNYMVEELARVVDDIQLYIQEINKTQ